MENIVDVLDEPEEHTSRIVQTMYYLDEYASGSKIILFTNYRATFEIFEEVLTDFILRMDLAVLDEECQQMS